MTACRFCELDPQRNQILHRYKRSYVMLSNPWLAEGRLLVIPNRHVEAPWDLTPAEDKEMHQTVIALEKLIVIKNIAPWCDVRQHYRPSLPESDEKVNHLHWHILPHRWKDRLYQECQIYESTLFQSQKFSPQEIISETKKMRTRLRLR